MTNSTYYSIDVGLLCARAQMQRWSTTLGAGCLVGFMTLYALLYTEHQRLAIVEKRSIKVSNISHTMPVIFFSLVHFRVLLCCDKFVIVSGRTNHNDIWVQACELFQDSPVQNSPYTTWLVAVLFEGKSLSDTTQWHRGELYGKLYRSRRHGTCCSMMNGCICAIVSVRKWSYKYSRYTIDNKPLLWTFYDKQIPPAYVRVAQATQLCHNEHNVRIVHVCEREMHHYLDNVHETFSQLIAPHRADYFRTNILG